MNEIQLNLDEEIMTFESVSVANVSYEPDIPSVFYGDEIAGFLASAMSEVSSEGYLSESKAISKPIFTK
ncbi:MAG: hypothetical protein KAU38_10090 [Desulfobacterales bacterium]|nr:hypothetical protein [Desulfobacterales bacterium]